MADIYLHYLESGFNWFNSSECKKIHRVQSPSRVQYYDWKGLLCSLCLRDNREQCVLSVAQ